MTEYDNDSLPRTTYSARIPASIYSWMREEVRGRDQSLNDFIVQAMADLKDFYGLPWTMAVRLHHDAAALKLDRREYMMHLLTRRYEQLLTKPHGFDKDEPVTELDYSGEHRSPPPTKPKK